VNIQRVIAGRAAGAWIFSLLVFVPKRTPERKVQDHRDDHDRVLRVYGSKLRSAKPTSSKESMTLSNPVI
jgi:hypothetical protein